MNFRILPLLAFSASSALAGDEDLAKLVTPTSSPSPWRIGGGYAQILGLKAEFKGLGAYNNPNTLQPLGSGLNRDYDNGFVRLDSSNNSGGQTWNWSYANNAQYNAAGTGSIDFSITNSLANAQTDEDGAAQPGFEFFALYDMGAAGFSGRGNRPATWGFRAGLQYARIDLNNTDQLSTGLTTTTDRFDLSGAIPPLAPYTGSFAGPGPLLGDTPTRSTLVAGSALVNGSRDLDVDMTMLNLGSYLEIPLTEKLALLTEAGLSLGVANGSYDFSSSTAITGLGTQSTSGSNSSTEVLPGAYLGLGASYQITDEWAILSSARYQYLRSYDLSANGSQASLPFNSSYVISLGAVFSF